MIRGRGIPTEIYNRIDTNINFLNNDDKDEGGRNSNRNINSMMMTRMMVIRTKRKGISTKIYNRIKIK